MTASRCSLTSLRVYADIVGRNAFGQKKMNIKPCVSIHCNIQTAQQHLNKDMMTTESKPSLLNKDMWIKAQFLKSKQSILDSTSSANRSAFRKLKNVESKTPDFPIAIFTYENRFGYGWTIEVWLSIASDGRRNVQRQPITNIMLVTRESAMMTKTIYVRSCDPGGEAGQGGPAHSGLLVAGRWFSPGSLVARRWSATPQLWLAPANPVWCGPILLGCV